MKFLHSLSVRLLWVCAAIVFIPVLFLNRYAVEFFDDYTRRALEKSMISTGRSAEELARASAGRAADLEASLRRLAVENESRIRLLDATGAVAHDTGTAGEPDPGPPAPADRPEVRQALSGAYGARWALTDDGRYVYYFVALPPAVAGGATGPVYISRTTDPIIKAIFRMRSNQRTATALAVSVAVAASLLMAFTLTRRLSALTRAAAAYTRGGSRFQSPVRGRDEVGELAAAMEQMTSELERRYGYNRDFIADLSHELRRPITAIRGAAELLEGDAGERPEARARLLRNIRIGADRLSRMVGELRTLARLDLELAGEPRDEHDYGAAVRGIVERVADGLDGPRARIDVSVPAHPLRARFAPGRIEQVLSNLLENACRYTPPEGRIEVVVEPAGPEIRTSVRDTGCGIAPEVLPKVFERFFTTEAGNPQREHGSGLGLAIAKAIVEHHRGRIGAESAPGSGSTFWFTLPAA